MNQSGGYRTPTEWPKPSARDRYWTAKRLVLALLVLAFVAAAVSGYHSVLTRDDISPRIPIVTPSPVASIMTSTSKPAHWRFASRPARQYVEVDHVSWRTEPAKG